MLRTKSGLPKHCTWTTDRHGKRRVRFCRRGFSTYLTDGAPWSEPFMRQYAAALDGAKAQATSVGKSRTIAGPVNALVVEYIDPISKTSPFKTDAVETRRTRRNILENFRTAYGHLPLFGIGADGCRTMLLTREHMQRIVNKNVVKVGPQHIHDGWLIIEQGKTEGSEAAHLEIPVHPKLREIIDATPTVGLQTFLVTHHGKPYTAPGFGNWFRELCDQAECFDISAHGGRMATARRLAEIGCSANQTAAITGQRIIVAGAGLHQGHRQKGHGARSDG